MILYFTIAVLQELEDWIYFKSYLEKYLFKHDNKGHKNHTWGSLVDEQGLEETENPAEHPWNLAVSSVQPKTSSVPDKAKSEWEVDFIREKQRLLPSQSCELPPFPRPGKRWWPGSPWLGQSYQGGAEVGARPGRQAPLLADTALSKVITLPADQLWLL